MKSTSNTQEKTVAQTRGYETKQVNSFYVEESPCIVFTAVDIAREFAQPRTMHEWLT